MKQAYITNQNPTNSKEKKNQTGRKKREGKMRQVSKYLQP
jgi:hypothetical protein